MGVRPAGSRLLRRREGPPKFVFYAPSDFSIGLSFIEQDETLVGELADHLVIELWREPGSSNA